MINDRTSAESNAAASGRQWDGRRVARCAGKGGINHAPPPGSKELDDRWAR